MQNKLIVIRGGGDLASGVALRLRRAGFPVVILELEKPLAVRRTVSFAEAVYQGAFELEGVTARLVSADQIMVALERGELPVLIDPLGAMLKNQFITSPRSTFVIDARLLKTAPEKLDVKLALHIGLGPGFIAGENCDAVIETQRGHTLGRVYWQGATNPNSGTPDGDPRRALHAPHGGTLTPYVEIGARLKENQAIAEIKEDERLTLITSPFAGILRGLIHPSVPIQPKMKIGDVDSRNDPAYCALISDKALAIGGGALEAVMSWLAKEEVI
ncbi:MAG: hypothetical protein Fur002_22000 [Anaerolineales bacterium]